MLAEGRDPIRVIRDRAQEIVVDALDGGWTGPPFDPFALAELRGISLVGQASIQDARIVPMQAGGFRIEFNPNRPPARMRYSVAHELAHTLFPDCAEETRNRLTREEMRDDEWQLEMLCNLAAAELLMPVGSLPKLSGSSLDIESLIDLRQRYEVSMEAILIRASQLASEPCAAFGASSRPIGGEQRFYVDYTIQSELWGASIPRGFRLPPETAVAQAATIGFTARGSETWPSVGSVFIECIGIPPYPGQRVPRVVGLLRSSSRSKAKPLITYLVGDATAPRLPGPKVIAHVVNDGAARWGAGFAAAIGRRWKDVQLEFVSWVGEDRKRLRLGNVHRSSCGPELQVVQMIAQRGYGASERPRIRYAALRSALEQVAAIAGEQGATVHMPRIGTGQAGGSWDIVEDLIRSTLGPAGISVYVYDLPGTKPNEPVQMAWSFGEDRPQILES